MNIFKLSWKNLLHKPGATLLSLILLSLGVGLISMLLLTNTQLTEKFEKNLAGIDLVLGAKGSPLQLILCNMYHIDAPTGNISIEEAKPFLNPNHPLLKKSVPLSVGDNYKGYRIIGTHPDFINLYNAKLKEGEIFDKEFEVNIGSRVAQLLEIGIGHKFHSSHGLIDDEVMIHDDTDHFVVTGIYEETGTVLDQLILCSTASVWAVHDHGPSSDSMKVAIPADIDLRDYPDKDITAVLIQYKSRTNFRALNLQRNINQNTDLQAASPAIELNRLFSMMDVGTQSLRILAFVIVFVSAISVFISLFTSLNERKYELALMRVVGFSPTALFFLIILEGIFLAFIGYLIGTALSHIGMNYFSDFMQENYQYPFTGWIYLKEEFWLFLATLALGFFAALLPAIMALKTDISTTLSEGS